MNYHVGDFITRIKNASLAKRKTAVAPYAKINKAIGQVLVDEGFLKACKEEMIDGVKKLRIELRYEDRQPVLTDLSLISKPSLRVYTKAKSAPRTRRKGLGVSVLSTNQGILTAEQARKKG